MTGKCRTRKLLWYLSTGWSIKPELKKGSLFFIYSIRQSHSFKIIAIAVSTSLEYTMCLVNSASKTQKGVSLGYKVFQETQHALYISCISQKKLFLKIVKNKSFYKITLPNTLYHTSTFLWDILLWHQHLTNRTSNHVPRSCANLIVKLLHHYKIFIDFYFPTFNSHLPLRYSQVELHRNFFQDFSQSNREFQRHRESTISFSTNTRQD